MAELFFKDARDYIHFEYELRRARRPAYSMRAFARDLAISHSSLNDFMKARVGMSDERIEKIAAALRWSPARAAHFRDLVQSKFDRDQGVRQACQLRVRSRLKENANGLSLDAFKVIADWYHLVIIRLCEILDHADENRLAAELKLPAATARRAVARLINLGLLMRTTSGLKPASQSNHYGDAGSSQAIRQFHSQMLDLAQKVLSQEPTPENDSQSLVFSVEHKDIEKMNAEIRRAVLAIASGYAQTEKPDCIQGLTLQIFPLWPGNPQGGRS